MIDCGQKKIAACSYNTGLCVDSFLYKYQSVLELEYTVVAE